MQLRTFVNLINSIEEIHEITHEQAIEKWFRERLAEIANDEKKARRFQFVLKQLQNSKHMLEEQKVTL